MRAECDVLGLLGMAPSGMALLRTSRFLYFALIFGLGRVLGCLGNGHGTLWHVYFHSLYCGKLWQGRQEHFERLNALRGGVSVGQHLLMRHISITHFSDANLI